MARSFALGFGPRLVEWTDRRGTVWSLSLLPMGGYVSFPGEQSATEEGGYLSRPPLARMVIIAAGPIANILVAIGIYAGIYTTQGMPIFLPVASSVVPDSLAALAGFLVLVTAGYGLSSILKARRITRAGTKRTAG